MKRRLIIVLLLFVISCNKENNPVATALLPGDIADPPQYGTPFQHIPAPEDIILYEINLRAFSSEGNISSITTRIDEISELGVNVIWLMPIHPVGVKNSVGQLGSPYSVKDYKKVNPEFGSLDDLRLLVETAHSKNIAVIIDWVANHTSWDNEWIKYSDWYTKDGTGNIIHPAGTNWLDVADLNYDNPQMRQAMIKAMKYWVLAANIDGFRCDAADMVPLDFWSQAIDTLRNISGRYLVLLAEGSRLDHYGAGFDLIYGWDYYSSLKNVFRNNSPAYTLYQTHLNEYNYLPSGKHRLRFTTNHDETAWDAAPVELFGGYDGAMAALAVTVFHGGAAMIYSGQEAGSTDKTSFFDRDPIDWSDPAGIREKTIDIFSVYKNYPAFRKGSTRNYYNADCVILEKIFETQQVLLITNVRNRTISVNIPGELASESWTNLQTGEISTFAGTISLNPYDYYVFLRN
ncbi:MAG: hypothetical protein K9I71_10930 [Ignavibacteriales bacterium]|nr:hypothetical protein [Ignavibacteriales bacterium]MCF8438247.1 hypothetical protein [Ignavibacteriales bacterium]